MKQCVDVMEDMLITLYKGDYVMGGQNHNSHGCMITFPDHPEFPGMPQNADDRRFMAMPAYLGGNYQMAGMKWYGSNVENKKKGLPRSILMMMLNDKDTGAPLALMSANLVSAYRTGGIPGVGAKYLARKDAKVASVIGPGVMGKTSLAAFLSVCPHLDTVKIKGRGQKSLDSFVSFIKEELPQIKDIQICETVEEAVRDSDIISFTTTVRDDVSSFPYINGDWVEAWEEEYPYPTYPQMQIIGTKFTDLRHEGKIKPEDIIDLTDVIEGRRPGRESNDDIIVYSVGGMPVEDIAWGGMVYRNAVKLGIGIKLPLWEKPEMA